MLLIGTITVIAVWLAFIWCCDPDGFREARVAVARARSATRDER
jgi:hypothetical protein